MESTLCLHYGAPCTMPLHIPSTMTTRATKLHFSSSHRSLLLSNGPTRHPLGHVLSPVIRAIDRSSMPSISDKADNKIAIGTMGVSLVLACALCITGCSGRMTPKAIAIATEQTCTMDCKKKLMPDEWRKLKPFSEMSVSMVSGKGKQEPVVLNLSGGKGPSKDDVDKYMMEVFQRTGNSEDSFKVLENKYYEIKKKYGPESTNNMEMALVEILIYQEKYKDALEYNCLKAPKGSGPNDYRVPLYKAIIYSMLNNKREARKSCEKFRQLPEIFRPSEVLVQ